MTETLVSNHEIAKSFAAIFAAQSDGLAAHHGYMTGAEVIADNPEMSVSEVIEVVQDTESSNPVSEAFRSEDAFAVGAAFAAYTARRGKQ